MGRLNFASRLIPGYKRMVRPIEALLRTDTEPVWTRECTDALNRLLECAAARLELRVYRADADLFVYASVSDGYVDLVFAQGAKLSE